MGLIDKLKNKLFKLTHPKQRKFSKLVRQCVELVNDIDRCKAEYRKAKISRDSAVLNYKLFAVMHRELIESVDDFTDTDYDATYVLNEQLERIDRHISSFRKSINLTEEDVQELTKE